MRMPGEPLGTVTGAETIPGSAPRQAAMRGPTTAAAMDAGPPPIGAELEAPSFGVREAPDLPYTETKGPRLDEFGYNAPADPSLVQPRERTGVLQVLSALRKAGLLTSIKTHIRNLGGSAGWQLFDEASKIPGSIVDIAISRVTKQRALTGPNLAAMARSAGQAATKGWQEAKEILRTGKTPSEVEELAEIAIKQFPGSKLLETYVNGVFRTLKAEDRLFKVYSWRRSLEDRAKAMALTEVRKGAITRGQVGERTREIIQNPPTDLDAAAWLDAEVATFNNSNLVSEARSAVSRTLQGSTAGKVADFAIDQAVPFVKTPTNVVARMLESSPAGFGKNVYQIARAITKKSFTAEQQRAFSQTFGRASAGSALLALGYIGYRDGWLTGLVENDLSRRARDLAAGRIPGAIKVGDTWLQLTGLAPIGPLLAIGATLARETEQEQEGSGTIPALEVAGQAIGDQPLLIGSKQIAEALAKPGTVGEKFAGGYLGSLVPAAASDLAEAIDPTQREATGITGRALSRIPGARNFLPEARDVLGQPRQDFGPGQAFLDPTRATTDVAQQNPLFAELVRLDKGISGFTKKDDETDDDYRARVQEFGGYYTQYGAQLMANRRFQRASDTVKRLALTALNDRAKALVGIEGGSPARLNPDAIMSIAEGAAAKKTRKEQAAQRGRR